MSLKPLKVVITGDTSGLTAAVGTAGKALKGISIAAGAAGVAVVGALAAMTTQGLRTVDANVKLARSMDATANALKAVQIAAGYAGVSVEEANASMQKMNVQLATAYENGTPAAEALRRLGMSAKDLEGLDADKRMAAIADRVKELGLNSSVTGDILRDLGVESKAMALLMIQGGDAIRAARAEVSAFGLELTDSQTAAIETANDSIARMSLVFEGLRQKLAAEVAPVLQGLADQFNLLAQSESVQSAIARLVQAFGNLSQVILSEDFIGAAVSGLEGLANIAAGVADGMVTLSQNTDVATYAMGGLAIAVAALGGPLWIVAGALAGALAGISAMRSAANDTAPNINTLADRLNTLAGSGANAAVKTKAAGDQLTTLAGYEGGVSSASGKMASGLSQIGGAASKSAGEIATLKSAWDSLPAEVKRFIDPSLGSMRGGATGGIGGGDSGIAELETYLGSLPAPPATPPAITPPAIIPPGGGMPSGVGGASSVASDLSARLEALTAGLMTETETVTKWHEEGLETLREAKEAELLTEEEYRKRREELEAQHSEKMIEIKKAELSAQRSLLSSGLGDLASLMSTGNKKLFKIGQAAAIANASISGYEAAVDAWGKGMKLGGPTVAAAFAGASLLKTGGLIAQIASQSPSGAGRGAISVSGGGVSDTAGANAQPTREANVTIYGNPTGLQIQELFDTLNEGGEQGYRVNLNVLGAR